MLSIKTYIKVPLSKLYYITLNFNITVYDVPYGINSVQEFDLITLKVEMMVGVQRGHSYLRHSYTRILEYCDVSLPL